MRTSVIDRMRRGAVTRARSIDGVDKAIIEALQKNGRESFRRIGRRIGVSEATVRSRYARLCADRRELLDLTNRMRAIGGVVSTESFLYLDMCKQLYDWGTHIEDGHPGPGGGT